MSLQGQGTEGEEDCLEVVHGGPEACGVEKKDQHSPPREEQGLHPPLKVIIPFYYFIDLCVHSCLHVHAHHGTPVEGRGQLAGVGSLLLYYDSWELNSGCQAWQSVPYPAVPSPSLSP